MPRPLGEDLQREGDAFLVSMRNAGCRGSDGRWFLEGVVPRNAWLLRTGGPGDGARSMSGTLWACSALKDVSQEANAPRAT